MKNRAAAWPWARSAPLALMLTLAALPVLVLARRFALRPSADFTSLVPSLEFAVAGATLATVVGALIGAAAATLRIPGGRAAATVTVGLIVAPPAFWWLGLTRVPPFGSLTSPLIASVVAGVAYAPVTLLLVAAAVREIPTSGYEAARLALGPVRRIIFVLFPLIRSAVIAGFLLTTILLLGESEIPFLFGFRTSMTDVVTTFSRTYDVTDVMPMVAPLVLTVFVLGVAMMKPVFAVLLPRPTAGLGVIRKRATPFALVPLLAVPGVLGLSVAGYAWAALSGGREAFARAPLQLSTAIVSVVEPVGCALVSALVGEFATYGVRRSPIVRPLAMLGLMVFCVPAAVLALGWIAIGQGLGGVAIPTAVAHVSRTIGLSVLAFVVGYARLPRSFDDAARLLPMSGIRRWWTVILPLLVPSVAAASALTAALVFADRDVASLLLPPGGQRLMLNLYLLSANAPSAAIGAAALIVFIAGLFVIGLAAAGPLLLRLRTRG